MMRRLEMAGETDIDLTTLFKIDRLREVGVIPRDLSLGDSLEYAAEHKLLGPESPYTFPDPETIVYTNSHAMEDVMAAERQKRQEKRDAEREARWDRMEEDRKRAAESVGSRLDGAIKDYGESVGSDLWNLLNSLPQQLRTLGSRAQREGDFNAEQGCTALVWGLEQFLGYLESLPDEEDEQW
jgi:hypothetical protein